MYFTQATDEWALTVKDRQMIETFVKDDFISKMTSRFNLVPDLVFSSGLCAAAAAASSIERLGSTGTTAG